jgi:L,D-peptidoglycan transpeptidase YkuD (ErfK/YbiS/YcfS/YnhG family)
MGYAPRFPEGSHGWEYHQVTERTAWVGNPELPEYNHLVVLPPGAPEPAWFQKERARLGDPAYAWKVLIEHNYPEAVPGLGSAIFFHFRRGENIPSAGCTTLPPEWMEKLVRWLDPAKRPEYVLLPLETYREWAAKAGWPLGRS